MQLFLSFHLLVCAGGVCAMYNMLDFPAATVPVTRETEEDQANLKDYIATDQIHTLIKQASL